ncbi:MAG: prephenate dehydratase [Mariprofundaceae bacterium]
MNTEDEKHSLDVLRTSIDAIDDELFALIRKRAALAAEVGARKANKGESPFYVPSREAEIIRRLLDHNDSNIPDAALHGIFREIIGACLALEHPLTVAYLGPEGTFTHTAASRQFGSSATYLACRNFDEVFDEVEAGRATYGVVPVENAFEGAVTHTLDLFVDRDVSICAEVLLAIHEHLLSHAGKIEDIKRLASHPQPLGQCKKWLQTHLPWADLVETSSTAKAAELAATDAQLAAIASEAVAERLGLPILHRNIEDYHDNTTRFLVIGQHDSPASGEDKTAIVMSVKDRPGALHALLQPFSERGIGLSRIESRPSKKKMWEYVFFVDVQGHKGDAKVADALAELEGLSGAYLKVLGSYPVSRQL